MMRVVLAHSPTERVVHETVVDVPLGSTVRQALACAGWLDRFPAGLDRPPFTPALWGRKTSMDAVLREGDRVELLRPLRVDPKVARRERFVGQGVRGAGLFAQRRPNSKAGY
jgi:uncharacterized protein